MTEKTYADLEAQMMALQLKNAQAVKAANDEFRKKIEALALPADRMGSQAGSVLTQIANQTRQFDQQLAQLVQTLDSQVNFDGANGGLASRV